MSLKSLKAELEARQVFKAWEIEENLDRFFCRPVAVAFTALFQALRITPNQVSLAGMLIGMASALFIFSPSYPLVIVAVVLLWLSEVLDAADGQLARLARTPSRYGRIIDGLCSMGLFIVLYFALGWGLYERTGRWIYPVLAVVGAVTHSLQSSLYDFYRMEYIRIVKKRQARDPDAPDALARTQRVESARLSLGRKAMLAMYQHYAWRQAVSTPTYQPLARAIVARFGTELVPERYAARYSQEQRKMVRWWNYLGSNTHLLALSAALLVRRPQWYLWATVFAFSLYAVVMSWAQASTSRDLIEELDRAGEEAAATGSVDAVDPGAADATATATEATAAAAGGASGRPDPLVRAVAQVR